MAGGVWGRVRGGVCAVVLIGAVASVGVAATPEDADVPESNTPVFKDGVEAYIYGYALNMLGITERVATTVPGFTKGASRAPINQFVYGTSLPKGSYKDVVLPSTSTLYESAFLDLAPEPMVMHIPAIDRFYLFQTLDAWTNVSSLSPGTRIGSKPGDYAFVGPGCAKPLPDNVTVIPMPTNTVWIIGRIFTTGTDADLKHLTDDILPGLTLMPLSAFTAGKGYTPPSGLPVDPSIDTVTPPLHQVANMDACAFFGTLAALMNTNRPLLPQDDRMVQRLENIGVVPGRPFDCQKISPGAQLALQGAVAAARIFLENPDNSPARIVDTYWSMPLNVGDYGPRYLLRAFVAEKALGANRPEDAVYAYSTVDGGNHPLQGTGKYQIRFTAPTQRHAAGEVPPVNDKAFWSVTIYNNDGTLVDNPNVSYNAIGMGPVALGPPTIQNHTACFNADKSIDLFLQADPPTDSTQLCNWLPIPPKPADPTQAKGDFIVFLRMYWPDRSVLERRWIPPGINPPQK